MFILTGVYTTLFNKFFKKFEASILLKYILNISSIILFSTYLIFLFIYMTQLHDKLVVNLSKNLDMCALSFAVDPKFSFFIKPFENYITCRSNLISIVFVILANLIGVMSLVALDTKTQ